jgi:hypothetical protein
MRNGRTAGAPAGRRGLERGAQVRGFGIVFAALGTTACFFLAARALLSATTSLRQPHTAATLLLRQPHTAATLPLPLPLSRAVRAGTTRREATDEKPAALLFGVGIFTGYSAVSAERRRAIVDTWLPSAAEAAKGGCAFRFVLGDPPAAGARAADVPPALLLHLPGVHDTYDQLPAKSAAFFRLAVRVWPQARYIVKVDDDVYLRPSALPLLLPGWQRRSVDYVGCMKSHAIVTDPAQRWAEPRALHLGGNSYFVHSWGSAYALSHRFASMLAALPAGALRRFANEDVSVGAWALALDVTLLDDRRMCAQDCGADPLATAVWNFSCTGVCDAPRGLRSLHAMHACSAAATPAALPPGATADGAESEFFPFAQLNALP